MVDHLDIVFTEFGDDFISASMPVDHRSKQPAGLLHGGASVALAETLGSVASAFCARDGGTMPVGIEINANHLRSARDGRVHGKVKPIRLGAHLHVWNIEVTDESGQLVCVSRLTVMMVPASQSSLK
jgi:1,4-dihydroxy-2-naphthoyl-CoA hydrolase